MDKFSLLTFRGQFLESFATKQISSSEDRLEETKRRKLAIKAQKLVELMMVSGIPTSSGFEERIKFSEIEIVDSNAIDRGVMNTLPEGNYINGWDVNVAGVRVTSVKRNIRYHKHAEFILRIKRKGELEHFVGRRYGDFSKLHRKLRTELPGRVLPALPKKNKSDTRASGLLTSFTSAANDSDDSSASSISTRRTRQSQNVGGASSLLTASSGMYSTVLFLSRREPGRRLILTDPIATRAAGSIRSARSGRSKKGASPRPSVDGQPRSGFATPDGNKEVSNYCLCRVSGILEG